MTFQGFAGSFMQSSDGQCVSCHSTPVVYAPFLSCLLIIIQACMYLHASIQLTIVNLQVTE
jgi:hypothetical protein